MSKGKDLVAGLPPQAWAYIIGIPVAVAVVYFGVLNPILKATGIKDDKADKDAKREQERQKKADWWKPSFWKNRKNRVTIDSNQADMLAQQIYDAAGFFNDDEEAVSDVFKNITSKEDLSRLADRFSIRYKKDLHDYLISFNEPDTMNEYVYIYVNELK